MGSLPLNASYVRGTPEGCMEWSCTFQFNRCSDYLLLFVARPASHDFLDAFLVLSENLADPAILEGLAF